MGLRDLKTIKEVNHITDVATEMGFHLKKVGRFYTLKEHDSIRINPDRNIFIQNSTGKSGSVIDFVSQMGNISLSDAMRKLIRRTDNKGLELNKPVKKEITKDEEIVFKLPPKSWTNRNVYAYLIKTRGISPDLVNKFINRKLLYQDKHTNCVFVSYKDGKPVFASKRSALTYKKYMTDVPGNNYKHGFFIDNKANKLIVTESTIDLMSKMDLMKMKSYNLNEYNFLALSGTGKIVKALEHHLSINKYDYVNLSLDNDSAGRMACRFAQNTIKEMNLESEIELDIDLPEIEGYDVKDYNDLLKLTKSLEKANELERIAENEISSDKYYEYDIETEV